MGVQDLTGAGLGGYRLQECLGFSSHTAVYRTTGRGGELALKIIDGDLEPEASLVDRLRHDADQLSRFAHPDITLVTEVSRQGTFTVVASPLVEAPTLRALLDRGPLPDDLAWGVLCQVADALDHLLRRDLSHRGVKPVNILVDEQRRVHLVEFGTSSRWTGQLALTVGDYRLADPSYLAPEHVRGEEPDGRADVYALAVLAFELLTGGPPFKSERATQVLRRSLTTAPSAPRTLDARLPPGVDVVLRHALAKDPRRRYQSTAEFIDQLIELPGETRITKSHHAIAKPSAPATTPATATALLRKLGMPEVSARQHVLLNAFHATAVRACQATTAGSWPSVLASGGLQPNLVDDLLDDAERNSSLESLSRLATGIESVHGEAAAQIIREWGRRTLDTWLRSTQRKPFRMRGRPDQRLRDTLYVLTQTLDRVRGERLHTWREFDRGHFWVVFYGNLLAGAHSRGQRPCSFSIGGLESALRWGGLANDWITDEVECGRITGSGHCVISVEYVTHR
ncbi:MAG: serine/threonine protein kinase [bacterium]|jgi:serine/threonine-protein kinase|nr:serine/threonine protein kinase [bacterium]